MFCRKGLKDGASEPVAQILGQGFEELSARNEIVDYPDQISAFGALLVGDIDGVVTRYQPAAVALARARIDYRVRVAGLPLRSESRVGRDPRIAIRSSAARQCGHRQARG